MKPSDEAGIPSEAQAALAAARDRYMYFTGVYTDRPVEDHRRADRANFAHLLQSAQDGRPVLSDAHCAEFMAAITGLPLAWCRAWEALAFDAEHGQGFAERQQRLQESAALQALHGV